MIFKFSDRQHRLSMAEGVGPQNGFSNLLKEKVVVQQIWAGININNSWERLLIHSSHSLAALEKLMVQSLTSSAFDSFYEQLKQPSTIPRVMASDTTLSNASARPNVAISKMSLETESSRSQLQLSPIFGMQNGGASLFSEQKHSVSSKFGSNNSVVIPSNEFTNENGGSLSTVGTNTSVRRRIINVVTEARTALESAHVAMNLIGKKTNDIPRTIGKALGLVEQMDKQSTANKIRDELKRLHNIIDDCAHDAFSLENLFQTAIQLADSKSARLGRSGFMLLGEVKHFWEKVVSFCREISKLIEYTLDSSCNALIAILLEQVENATVRSKFRLKDRVRHEIYQVALACVAYALSVRHLTDAYSAFSREFLMPQMDAISRYPVVVNSEIELAQAREQFKELNAACSKEIDRVVKTNRATTKRRSILELDFGLDLHLSDISADLDEFLTPIAQFKLRSGNKKLSSPDEGKSSNVFERFRSSFMKKQI
uniref:Uncharacterized protein n=1 Tax=Parascaris univalens TaxID=6257 RepID=A0A914ZXK6_PARUN